MWHWNAQYHEIRLNNLPEMFRLLFREDEMDFPFQLICEE